MARRPMPGFNRPCHHLCDLSWGRGFDHCHGSVAAGDAFRQSNTSVDEQGQPMLRLRHSTSGSIGSGTVTPRRPASVSSVTSQASTATLRLDPQASDIAHGDNETVSEIAETRVGLSPTGAGVIAAVPGSAKRSRRNTPLITVEDHDAPGRRGPGRDLSRGGLRGLEHGRESDV